MTRQLSGAASHGLAIVIFAIVVVVAVIPIAIITLGPSDQAGERGIRMTSAPRLQVVPLAKMNNHQEAIILASEFRLDADTVVANLGHAEAWCSFNVTALVLNAGVAADRVTPILNQANAQLKADLGSAVSRVRQEESDVAHLRPLNTDTMDLRFADLNSIAAAGLSDACATTIAQVNNQLHPPPAPVVGGGEDGGRGGDGGGD